MRIPTDEYLNRLNSRPYIQEYLSSPARFKALMWHRGAEKTAALLNNLLIEAHQTKGLYWYIGPYRIQAEETVWTDPNTSIFRWIPEAYRLSLKINQSDLSITLPNQSVIQLKGADRPQGLRGPKPQGIAVDEYGEIAKRWKSEFREAILEPSVRSSGGWIHYAGTPTGQNDFTYVFSLSKQDSNWFSSKKTIEDTGIYSASEIEEIKRNAVNEDFFKQEYYCEIIEGAASVFKGVQAAVKGEFEKPLRAERYIFGIDLARTFDHTVIVGFKASTNHLIYFKRLQNVTWETQKLEIGQILKQYNDAEAVVDATGVGDSFVEQLLQMGLRIMGLKIANNLIKRNLVEKLASYIQNQNISYPYIPELIDELNQFEYKLTARSNVIYSAPSGKHDDIVMALALACSRINPIPEPANAIAFYMPEDPRTGYIA